MLEVLLVTTDKVLYEGKARSVIVPGEEGVFEVLTYHKPIMSRLITGRVFIDNSDFKIRRGIIGVGRNKATLIVEQ
ncbi:MAG: hypothetical protein KKE64_01310 [Candidatus Omnitrophica bacterium]|nr:hypothetical protein [Candidatus Omnitrophota bacterium]